MGLQWCPRDPEVRIGEQQIHLHVLVPIEHQNHFTQMDVHFSYPPGREFVIERQEEREVTTGCADSSLRDEGDVGFEYAVACSVHGVPPGTPMRVMIEEPWNGTCKTYDGSASGLTVERWLR